MQRIRVKKLIYKGENSMLDYEKLFYESQAQLADIADELEKLALKIKQNMCEAEEKIISDGDDSNND